MTVLAHGDRPELYGLPRDPSVPLAVRLWKGPLKWIGNLAMLGGVLGVFVHYVRFGRKDLEGTEGRRQRISKTEQRSQRRKRRRHRFYKT